jgi:hypothetical protein
VVSAAAGAAVTTTYAADTFDRANATGNPGTMSDGINTWIASTGSTWNIASNNMVSASGNGTSDSDIRCNDGGFDGTWSVTFPSFDPTFYLGGLLMAASSASDGYVFHWFGSNYQLRKRTSISAYTVLGTATGTPGAAGDVLTVIRNGNTFTCKINGNVVITYTDSASPYTGTQNGLWCYNGKATRFDNYSHLVATS